MKKTIFIKCLILISAVSALAAVSYASERQLRPYFALKGAVSFVQSDFDLGYYERDYYYYGNGYYNGYYYNEYYDESSDAVFAGSAALGMKAKYFRVEFEYTRRMQSRHTYDWFPDLKQEFDSYIVNCFLDWPVTPKIEPYFGFSLGMTHSKNTIKYPEYEETFSRNRFSAGADMGVSFAVSRHFNLDCGFKVLYLGTVKIENEDLNTYAADLYLALRYTI